LEHREGGYDLINPLLECTSDRAQELRPFEDVIAQLVRDVQREHGVTEAAVYFRDLDTGKWLGVNERELFTPASLVKVPIMMAYLKEAEADPDLLQKKLVYNPTSFKDSVQNVEPRETLIPGNSYTIQDLIERMITFSDNRAMDLLLEFGTGEKVLERTFIDLDIQVDHLPDPDRETDILSVKEYAGFFRILYNASYLNRAFSNIALSILSNVDFVGGLSAGVPFGVVVAHKFGERETSTGMQLHDCGIIYHPLRPYLLCIMTRGKNFNHLEEAISYISHGVYEEVDRQIKARIY